MKFEEIENLSRYKKLNLDNLVGEEVSLDYDNLGIEVVVNLNSEAFDGIIRQWSFLHIINEEDVYEFLLEKENKDKNNLTQEDINDLSIDDEDFYEWLKWKYQENAEQDAYDNWDITTVNIIDDRTDEQNEWPEYTDTELFDYED